MVDADALTLLAQLGLLESEGKRGGGRDSSVGSLDAAAAADGISVSLLSLVSVLGKADARRLQLLLLGLCADEGARERGRERARARAKSPPEGAMAHVELRERK